MQYSCADSGSPSAAFVVFFYHSTERESKYERECSQHVVVNRQKEKVSISGSAASTLWSFDRKRKEVSAGVQPARCGQSTERESKYQRECGLRVVVNRQKEKVSISGSAASTLWSIDRKRK